MIEKSWTEPQQARSQKRFDHILATAETLFARDGYEAVTTNQIAAEAAVSIGALYRFFPNKASILDALIFGYMGRMKRIFPEPLDLERPYPDVLEELVRNIVALDKQEAAFGQILIYAPTETARLLEQGMVGQVAHLIGSYHPQLQGEPLLRCATVGVGIVRGLMSLLEEMGTETAVVEMKRALLAYLNACLAEGA